jgi:hypothetical protein
LPIRATQNINTQFLKKTIVYLYRGDTVGHPDPGLPLGTGFLVQVPLLSNPNLSFLVLVTARHMIDPAWNHCPDSQPQVIYARYNKKVYDPAKDESGIDYFRLDLYENGNPRWSRPNEEDADVAVVLLKGKLIQDKSDAEGIPISDFATDDEAKQKTTTDPVLSVGLLPAYPGVKRNYPAWKFGQISDKPEEPVPVPCVKDGATTLMRLWFMSINLVPGNSGSPIFYAPEGSNGVSFGGGRPFLMGLQSASFLGADISGMTPVQYIFEAIQNLKLQDADLYRGLPENKPKAN